MDDSDDDADLWTAAGFVRTPEAVDANAVDPDELRAQLSALV